MHDLVPMSHPMFGLLLFIVLVLTAVGCIAHDERRNGGAR